MDRFSDEIYSKPVSLSSHISATDVAEVCRAVWSWSFKWIHSTALSSLFLSLSFSLFSLFFFFLSFSSLSPSLTPPHVHHLSASVVLCSLTPRYVTANNSQFIPPSQTLCWTLSAFCVRNDQCSNECFVPFLLCFAHCLRTSRRVVYYTSSRDRTLANKIK